MNQNTNANGKLNAIIFLLVFTILAMAFHSFCIEKVIERKIDNTYTAMENQNDTRAAETTENIINSIQQSNTENQTDFLNALTDINTVNTNELMVIDESQVTEELLTNRNGKIIISRVVGKMINENGDGEVINGYDGDYITYRNVKGAEVDNIIVTYLVYNPDNNAIDDIICRFDYIVSTDDFGEVIEDLE